MMDAPIITYVPRKEEVIIEEKEVYRYLGYSAGWIAKMDTDRGNGDACDPEECSSDVIKEYIREAIASTEAAMLPKACYGRFPVEVKGDGRILLPYGEVISHDLTKNLYGCKEIFLFAATIGTGYDRLLRRTRIASMARTAILQAAGAAAVEGLCDKLNDDLRRDAEAGGYRAHPRYSPGYGDYALENQKGIFAVLQPSRYIGLSLMDTLIMAPEKSVTAVIGLE